MTVIINGTNGITSVNGTAAAPSVTGTDTDTGIVYGTNTLSLATGGTTGMTMDSSQNVGIGTATPAAKLNVNNGFLQVDISGTQAVRVGSSDSIVGGTDNNGILQTNTSKALLFYAGGSERMRINATAPILCLSGGSTTATGTGIAFPATQSASSDANTLDDYEEGTWTPALTFGGGSTGLTYNSRYGFYTKVGNLVSVTCYYSVANRGSSTGAAIVTGLPFNLRGGSGMYSRAPIYYNGLASAVTTEVCYSDGNTSYVNLVKQSGTGTSNWTEANFTAGTDMMITFCYLAA